MKKLANTDLKQTRSALNKFAKAVIYQSKLNLGKKEISGKLAKSLKYKEILVGKNSFQLDFIMELYGLFQDKGVKGAKSRYPKIEKGHKGKFYSYKKPAKGNRPPASSILEWVEKKRFQFQEPRILKRANGKTAPNPKAGQFMSYKTMSYIIANSVWKKGIKPSLFFTSAFKKEFKNLNQDLVDRFGLDAKSFVISVLQNEFKEVNK